MAPESVFHPLAILGAFVLLAAWEWRAPWIPRTRPRRSRWMVNLGIGVIGLMVTRLLFGTLVVTAAAWGRAKGWGILASVPWPFWAKVALAFLALDLAVYAQHVATHAWPPLWRLHRIHHADRDMDISTALRFHPLELVVSLAYKATVALCLGAPPVAALAFEAALSLGSLFTHTNGRMAPWLEGPLRGVLVTPGMHAIHHSNRPEETDSNYGFFLSVWDRIFRTYRSAPRHGLVLGLKDVPDLSLGSLLVWPFKTDQK